MNRYNEAVGILEERFGCDTVVALATVDGGQPSVRMVNSYYEAGAFYSITYALSNKIRQITKDPAVAVCGEWFTAHGIGENLGWVGDEKNTEMMTKLRVVFAKWYNNGHTDESDPQTCLLRIRLTDGVLLSHGTKYNLNFVRKTA